MILLYPELLLLVVPIGWVLLRTAVFPSLRWALRALAAAAVLIAVAGPYGEGLVQGRDFILVVDRSRSMPGGSTAKVAELFDLAREGIRPGDRLGLVAFGADSMIELPPQEDPVFEGYRGDPDPDGSHLAAALDRALTLIPQSRPGSLLVYSDGEFHGETPDRIARRAASRGIAIDVRSVPRENEADVAVDRFDLPQEIEVGEPFQFQAWVRAESETQARYTLFRGENIIAQGERTLRPGLNPMRFRDMGQQAGLANYRLQLDVEGDRILNNNQGLGVARVVGARPILLINGSGQTGRLAQALLGAGLSVEVVSSEFASRQPSTWLENYRAFVLENVQASELGVMLPHLARQVKDLGAGLLMTGGRASFGVGGYYLSALEDVLPVTMELRVENRKIGLALAVVLDRSGSMGASAGGSGLTKMDLANAGTMEAIRLLAGIDEAAVIAVDSSPHVVVPLTRVTDSESFTQRVSGIRAGGGGIYTYTGLLAAAQALEQTSRASRHIVLFADAADAEEPGKYRELIEQLAQQNTTISVVALGQETDSDAAFLTDVARRGGGEIYFSMDPNELPRLFAQDTMLAARSAFIEELTSSETTPDLFAVSALPPGQWLPISGYNLTYLRPNAAQGVQTSDEYRAPIAATMQAGLGRAAAFTQQVDGRARIADQDWPEAAKLLVTMARWAAGQQAPEQYFASVRREGRQAVVQIERDAELGPAQDLTVRMVSPEGRSVPVELTPIDSTHYEARVPLAEEGVYRFAGLTESGELLTMDSVAIPYSPEFEPRAERDSGARALSRLALLSQGLLNPTAADFWRGKRGGSATRSWGHWFVLAALLLILLEIAWRRLFEAEFARYRQLRKLARATKATQARQASTARAEAAITASPIDQAVQTSTQTRATQPDEKSASKPTQKTETKEKTGLEAALSKSRRKRRR